MVKAQCEVERKTDDVAMRCSKVKEGSAVEDASLYDTTVPFSRVGRYIRCVHGLSCVVNHDVGHPFTAMR